DGTAFSTIGRRGRSTTTRMDQGLRTRPHSPRCRTIPISSPAIFWLHTISSDGEGHVITPTTTWPLALRAWCPSGKCGQWPIGIVADRLLSLARCSSARRHGERGASKPAALAAVAGAGADGVGLVGIDIDDVEVHQRTGTIDAHRADVTVGAGG